MTQVTDEKLIVVIQDAAPAERREWLISALADMLRNYALNPEKRKEDHESAAVIADLIKELNYLDQKETTQQ